MRMMMMVSLWLGTYTTTPRPDMRGGCCNLLYIWNKNPPIKHRFLILTGEIVREYHRGTRSKGPQKRLYIYIYI